MAREGLLSYLTKSEQTPLINTDWVFAIVEKTEHSQFYLFQLNLSNCLVHYSFDLNRTV